MCRHYLIEFLKDNNRSSTNGNVTTTTINNIVFISGDQAYPEQLNELLETAKSNNIHIDTVALPNSTNSAVLQEISSKTGGEFVDFENAASLVNYQFSDSSTSTLDDKTDTDGDTLPDLFEDAGMLCTNGQILYSDSKKIDTDNDSLEDGEEVKMCISPQTTIPDSKVPSYIRKAIPYRYIFIEISDPSSKDIGNDSDRDGYCDSFDEKPMVKDAYDFLNNEYYNLSFIDENVIGQHLSPEGYNYVSRALNNINDYLSLIWVGNGYKIKYDKTNTVLTLKPISPNNYSISFEKDSNLITQIWEIGGYKNKIDGLYNGEIIKSKYIPEGDSLYLSHSKNAISVTEDKNNNTDWHISNSDEWYRFGYYYMNFLGWENDRALYNPNSLASQNYYNNSKYAFDFSNKTGANLNLLIYQSGGTFPKLKYGKVTMDGVACEIIATYNALTLAGKKVDFYKLALEFEINNADIYCPKEGYFGSDPEDIGNCLTAYKANYKKVTIKSYNKPVFYTYSSNTDVNKNACIEIDNELNNGKCAILSSRFEILNLAIHTFCIDNNRNAYNRYSNDTTTRKIYSIKNDVLAENEVFYIGYIVY